MIWHVLSNLFHYVNVVSRAIHVYILSFHKVCVEIILERKQTLFFWLGCTTHCFTIINIKPVGAIFLIFKSQGRQILSVLVHNSRTDLQIPASMNFTIRCAIVNDKGILKCWNKKGMVIYKTYNKTIPATYQSSLLLKWFYGFS